MTARANIDASVLAQLDCRFRVVKSGTQSVNSGSWTTITWETEDYDTGNDFNTSTERFTAPYTGLYAFDVNFYYSDAIADGKLVGANLLKNGTTFMLERDIATGASLAVVHGLSVAAYKLTAGDTVEAQSYHNHGSARTMSADATLTFFQGCLVALV